MKLIKIILITLFASFCIAGSAFALAGGVSYLAPFSEPLVMLILGTSLIGVAGFGRQKLGLKKSK